MGEQAQCWKCGATVAEQLLVPGRRVARQAECPQCRTELHVCRACTFYDTRVAKQCRETIAEEVKDKQAANFCDYFRPTPSAYRPEALSAADKAKAELEALFGHK
mgnify:CR=1 FL=1